MSELKDTFRIAELEQLLQDANLKIHNLQTTITNALNHINCDEWDEAKEELEN